MNLQNAETLNNHLRNGGSVHIGTYTHHTTYKPKHAGMFYNGAKTGDLLVKHGKGANRLTQNGINLVRITLLEGR